MTLLAQYERLFRRVAHYEADYSIFGIRRDGVLRAPRILLWAQWALYSGALASFWLILGSAIDVHWSLPLLVVLSTLPLWARKISSVLDTPAPRPLWHQCDLLDWFCDVGAWGTAGALVVAQLLGGYPVSPIAYASVFVLWLLTFAWSSP